MKVCSLRSDSESGLLEPTNRIKLADDAKSDLITKERSSNETKLILVCLHRMYDDRFFYVCLPLNASASFALVSRRTVLHSAHRLERRKA